MIWCLLVYKPHGYYSYIYHKPWNSATYKATETRSEGGPILYGHTIRYYISLILNLDWSSPTDIYSDSLSEILCWHSILHVFWHSIWHVIWHVSGNCVWHSSGVLCLTCSLTCLLAFYLQTYFLTFLADVYPDILSNILSGILSDIFADIHSDILSGDLPFISWHNISDNIWRFTKSWGHPQLLSIYRWIFPYKPSSYWDTPILGNPYYMYIHIYIYVYVY